MIVAGVGCRKGVRATDIEAVIRAAFVRAGVAASQLRLIATSAAKGDESAIAEAAVTFGVPVVLISQGDLVAAGVRAKTRSERVIALVGVPSVAEAAALAAGGAAARLIGPRLAVGGATCALVEAEGTHSPPSKSAVADLDHVIEWQKPAYTRFRLGNGRHGGPKGTVLPSGTTPSPREGGEKKGRASICDSPTDTEAGS